MASFYGHEFSSLNRQLALLSTSNIYSQTEALAIIFWEKYIAPTLIDLEVKNL